MKIGILTRNPNAWAPKQLEKAILKKGHEVAFMHFRTLVARVSYSPKVKARDTDILEEVPAIIVRPIGRCSLDQAIFRMDVLHRLTRLGITVINHPSAIEKCIDKFYALTLLEESGIPVPRTVITESVREAINAFYELGCDVVVKPLFGSRGLGLTRVLDPEIARRIFNALNFVHKVLYIQEFIPHGNRDIRAFVIGDEVIASMYRESTNWKTNIAQGARPKPLKLSEELEELAVKAAKVVNCEIAGVDILESPKGYYITEINSQPGWRGIQSVTRVNIADHIIEYVLAKIKE